MKHNRKALHASLFALILSVCFFISLALLSGHNAPYPAALADSVEETTSGQLNYSDGSLYEGEIQYGRIRNGTGTFSWSTGESYEGTWSNDYQHGSGKLIWPGFGEYNGDFVEGKRHGHGVFTWYYEGGPQTGQPVSFDGEWENDKIGSSGIITFAGLGVYEGAFAKGVRSGVGKFTWDNGDQYYGAWQNDVIDGDGILTLSDGTVLEGNFSKNVLTSGTATYAVAGGKAIRKVIKGKTQADITIVYDNGITVSGKLKGEEFTGNVTITYPSGDVYIGQMSRGVKSGKGTYTWSSGAHYVGQWSNDKMSGTGKYYYSKDESVLYLSGSFVDGKPNGKVIYVSEKKLKYETVWSNGSCTSIRYKK